MRDVLRGVASLYYPIGLYSPLLQRHLHREQYELVQPLNENFLERWSEITEAIDQATKEEIIVMPRSYSGTLSKVRELHVFCNASKRAFVPVAYLVYEQKVSFVMWKTH